MAIKKFTLIFVMLFSLALWGQGVDTKGGTPPGDGNQSGPTFPGITVTGCTMDGAVCGGFIRRGSVQPVDLPTSPDPGGATEIPSSGGPNLSGNIDASQGGSGGGSASVMDFLHGIGALGMAMGGIMRSNAWGNMQHAEEGDLAGLQYLFGGSASIENGLIAYGSGTITGDIKAMLQLTGRQLLTNEIYAEQLLGETPGKHMLIRLGELTTGKAELSGPRETMAARAAYKEFSQGRRTLQEILKDSSVLRNNYKEYGESLKNVDHWYLHQGLDPKNNPGQQWFDYFGFRYNKFPKSYYFQTPR